MNLTFKQFLTEANSTPIICVDIQPAYHDYLKTRIDIDDTMEFMSRCTSKMLVFFNGDDVGIEDKEPEVEWYFQENGYEPRARVKMIEKGYAFFRNWMDQGVSDATMIKVIRKMAMERNNDARDLDDLEEFLGDEWEDFMEYESFYIPDVSLRLLKEFNGCYLIGGGEHECLAEIKLLMDAFNIKYTLVKEFIY